MRNFIWSLLLFVSGIFISFSQTNGIEKGTYLANNKGQSIKLNLLDNNKYELVFYTGEYEIKGDSLLFIKKEKPESNFDLAFATNKKSKKIKIQFLDLTYDSFYLGTQKGSESIVYQRLSDLKNKIDPNWEKADLEFEIEKTDYLYLVYENYDGKSNVCKYALPKDVSEVTIKFDSKALADLKICGFFDRKTNELKISDRYGENPLVFLNEKEPQPVKPKKVIPLEDQIITNWTYPGKDPDYNSYGGAELDSIYNGSPVDTTAVAVADYPIDSTGSYSRYDFKLKIEDNLKKAIESTKTASNKFLVVVADSKNKTAKEGFDTFIKDQETQVGYNMYDKYDGQYDLYNYYLAGAEDKKWLKSNKITYDQSIFILNGNGDLLAVAKSDLTAQQYQFSYYGDFYKKLQGANAFLSIDKVLKNKKASDSDLITAFNKAALLETSYDSAYTTTDPNSTDFVIVKTNLDQKEVAQTWKKLIESHQKDTKPDMYLVETMVREIKNQGFTKQLFDKERVLNDTDFLAIDYLLKHSDKIEENRTEFNSKEGEVHNLGNVITEISSALQSNNSIAQEKSGSDVNKQKNISIYKKIIALGKGNFESYSNYFQYLNNSEDATASNIDFLKEFSTYFDSRLASSSPIEKLDEIYSTLDSNSAYAYNGWNSFKDYHSNLCNNAAWSVVLQQQNAGFLKDAIKWSEYSLVVTKNNPYYLDTLAQLYYKDGQKQKAIETQALAVKFLNAVTEPETAADIKETLDKMKNGTY